MVGGIFFSGNDDCRNLVHLETSRGTTLICNERGGLGQYRVTLE
jgi:hypothetical protein